jgi:AcrR family transcriptional regulator
MIETPKIDRRAARTRDELHQALMSLILEKGYGEVTVAEICDSANVGRSTFYAHFTCKDDLRRHGVDHVRQAILQQRREAVSKNGESHDRPLAFSLTMFEHARDHLDRHKALAGSDGGSVILATIRQTLSDLVDDELASRAEKDSVKIPRDLVIHYVVGAFMGVLTWWLDGGAKLPPEEVDVMFRRLATEGIMYTRSPSCGSSPPLT